MFCHKCGTQIADGAGFCHKCGTKVVYVEAAQHQDIPTHTIEPQQASVVEPAQHNPVISVQASSPAGDGYGFREFVDSRVRATTEYGSAEELLGSHVPQKFVWICFGVPAVLFGIQLVKSFSLQNVIGTFGGILLLGYMAALLVDFILAVRTTLQTSRNATKFSENLDINDLICFLNTHLAYWKPWFHEWGYMQQVGVGIGAEIAAAAINSAATNSNEIILGTEFGDKGRCFAKINIKNDVTAINAGYSFSAAIRGMALWSARYACIIKIAPILQAAMEYYLTRYIKD